MYIRTLFEFLRSLVGVSLETALAGFPIGHVGVHEAFNTLPWLDTSKWTNV
jgi:hypothetical protein